MVVVAVLDPEIDPVANVAMMLSQKLALEKGPVQGGQDAPQVASGVDVGAREPREARRPLIIVRRSRQARCWCWREVLVKACRRSIEKLLISKL